MKRFAICLTLFAVAATTPAGAQSADVLRKINARYERVSAFDEGLAFVVKGNKYGYVDTLGRVVVPLVYDLGVRFREGHAAVALGQGSARRWGLIDRTGRKVGEFCWERLGNVCDGVAVGRRTDSEGRRSYSLLDTLGNVRELPYARCDDFSNGLAVVGIGTRVHRDGKSEFQGKYGYITPDGELAIPARFDKAGPFNRSGLAPVGIAGPYYVKWGFIDRNGDEAVACRYYSVAPFRNGRAVVGRVVGPDRLAYGYVDTTGEEVIPCRWDEATDFRFANTWVGIEEESGMWYALIDAQGREILPYRVCALNDSGKFGHASCAVMRDGVRRFGVLDNRGRTVVPFEYDEITIFTDRDPATGEQIEAGYAVRNGKRVSFTLHRKKRTE